MAESRELRRRDQAFGKSWEGKFSGIVVQTNFEDRRLGIDAYALSKLEVSSDMRNSTTGIVLRSNEV